MLLKVNLRGNKIHKNISAILTYFCVSCLVFLILYPILIKIFSSLRSMEDLYDSTVQLIPKHMSMEILILTGTVMKYIPSFINSVLLSLLVAVLQVASSASIGYGLAKFKFKGRGLVYALVIITLLIPKQTITTALFLNFRYHDILGVFELITGNPLNLIGTIWPFVLLSITGFGLKNGLYIYLTMQTFKGLPKEFDEAASVDGAGVLKTFFCIMLPNAKTILVTVFLFSFCWQWTDSYYSGLFVKDMNLLSRTIYYVVNYGNNGSVDQVLVSALQNAAILLLLLPLLILYLFCQKSFIQGVAKSGITG